MPDLAHPCLVFGHRGLSERYPENTLISFEASLDAGADGCECDVHRSRDGVIFLLHDHTLQRTAGNPGSADALTWDELERLDAGAWKGPQFAGTRLPTLEQALALHRGRGQLVIEIKGQGEIKPVVDGVLDAIAQTDAYGWCSAISFQLEFLVELAPREPRVPCLLLLGEVPAAEADRRALMEHALAVGLRGFSVYHGALDAAFIRLAHSLALSVWTWTNNDDASVDASLAVGVDAICTDRPDWLLGKLTEAAQATA